MMTNKFKFKLKRLFKTSNLSHKGQVQANKSFKFKYYHAVCKMCGGSNGDDYVNKVMNLKTGKTYSPECEICWLKTRRKNFQRITLIG